MLDGRQLAGRLGDVERAMRKLEAVAVSIVAEADRREVFRDDGHVCVHGWVKASIRVADVAATHRVRTAKLARDLPLCGDSWRPDGWVSIRSVSWPGCTPTRAAATSSRPASTD